MRSDFCALILTHGRAANVKTIQSLERAGYTGDTYLLVDDEDDQWQEYERRYPGQVVRFCKDEAAAETDAMDNFGERRVILYARNWAFHAAKQLGYRYFIELDDDYTRFDFRFIQGKKLASLQVRDMDALLEAMVGFLDESGALSVAMMQAGDFIGGAESNTAKYGWKRKAMNSFVCDVERPFRFFGSFNEDVNAYTVLGGRGGLFLSFTDVSLVQGMTQQNTGGMSGAYLDLGTYTKSFYSVMGRPDSVVVKDMGNTNRRLHHRIDWGTCVPKIVPESLRKT